jgi:hypothetical protein
MRHRMYRGFALIYGKQGLLGGLKECGVDTAFWFELGVLDYIVTFCSPPPTTFVAFHQPTPRAASGQVCLWSLNIFVLTVVG